MNKENIKELILIELKKINREGIEDLIKWLIKNKFFESPASTHFHCCYKGGLAEHSYNVYKLLKIKNEYFKLGLKEESIIISSIFHDLCKVNIYKDNILKTTKKQSKSKPFICEDNFPLGHGTKSVFIVSQFIRLTKKEALMIRWHMGLYDYEFKKYIKDIKKVAPCLTALHTSDIEASNLLEEDGLRSMDENISSFEKEGIY